MIQGVRRFNLLYLLFIPYPFAVTVTVSFVIGHPQNRDLERLPHKC